MQPQIAAQAAFATGGRAIEVPAAPLAREAQAPIPSPPGGPSPAPASRRKNENGT